jgi:hypothetical protein
MRAAKARELGTRRDESILDAIVGVGMEIAGRIRLCGETMAVLRSKAGSWVILASW